MFSQKSEGNFNKINMIYNIIRNPRDNFRKIMYNKDYIRKEQRHPKENKKRKKFMSISTNQASNGREFLRTRKIIATILSS